MCFLLDLGTQQEIEVICGKKGIRDSGEYTTKFFFKNYSNSCKHMLRDNFTGREIMRNCTAFIQTYCPFNISVSQSGR